MQRRGRQGGGRGPPERQTLSSEKRALGPVSPVGGWRPRTEVCSFPTKAVPGWWPLGAVGSSCHPGSCLLPLGDRSLPPQDNVNFCSLLGQPPTSPASQPLLLVTSEAPLDLQRKRRRKNTTGKKVVTTAPRALASPLPGCPDERLLEVDGDGGTGGGRWKK